MKIRSLGFPLLKVAIRFEPDVVTARQKTRRLAKLIGYDNQDQARLATAVSELARNVYQYAGTGSAEFFLSETAPQALYVRVSDSGPGIAAINDILNGSYVSNSGMGVGLSGTRKLMDHFEIESTPGQGTVITIGKMREKRARLIEKADLPRIVDQLASKTSETPFEEIQNQNRDLLNALEEVRHAKEELAELNRELAETNRGVVALYAELDEKAASLQRANEVKTSFLSHMTHEFRTPLSSVISLTGLLLSRIDGELTQEQERQVLYIRRSSESLLELVNDLLDLAKVEAGKVSINAADFDVEEVLGGLRGMFRPILNNFADVQFNIELRGRPFILHTDQAKLSQILRNLVSNAVKFTEAGSVTITARADDRGIARFAVSDTGVGIDPKHLETIFEDFGQVDSALQRKQKGTGLGLPLSRKLARLLGGDIWVESSIGQGSTFHVAVPQIYTGEAEAVLIGHHSDPASKLSPQTDAQDEISGKFRVLLIDDDEPSRYVLKTLVSKELDADFAEASNGKAGLDYVRKWRPDLVFLDLSMPETDGFEVLRTVKRDKNFEGLPVIVNTAKKLDSREKEILESEATAVLSKERTDHERAVRELKEALLKAGFDYRNR